MKLRIIILALLLLPSGVYSQEFTDIVEVPGKSIDQLYSLAREWIAVTFKSANNVLQMDDPIAGKLIGKAAFQINLQSGSMPICIPVFFTVKIMVKDATYKYDIVDINIESGGILYPIDYYKAASTQEGAKETLIRIAGMKNPSEKTIKKTAAFNAAIYKVTNEELEKLTTSLKAKMSMQDDW